MTPEERAKLEEVYAFIQALKASGSFDFDVEQALRDRLNIPVQSSKTAASETQAVSEGGGASYSVAKPMNGFEERVIAGEKRFYPYYTD